MVCVTVTIDATTDCSSLAVDTWEPAKLNPASGEDLNFVLRSNDANKYFELRRGLSYVITSGTTDSTGCYSGTMPAQPDDITYGIGICYPILGICIPFDIKNIIWSGGGGIPAGFALLVNGAVGNVKVDLNTDVTFHVKDASPGETISIKNISALPDITQCSGIVDSAGIYECVFKFTKDEIVEFQAYSFSDATNIVSVTAGNPTEPLDIPTMIMYGVGVLAAAYVLGNLLKSGD